MKSILQLIIVQLFTMLLVDGQRTSTYTESRTISTTVDFTSNVSLQMIDESWAFILVIDHLCVSIKVDLRETGERNRKMSPTARICEWAAPHSDDGWAIPSAFAIHAHTNIAVNAFHETNQLKSLGN